MGTLFVSIDLKHGKVAETTELESLHTLNFVYAGEEKVCRVFYRELETFFWRGHS
jgi:hypothetical protein